MRKTLWAMLVVASPAFSQVSNPSIISVSVAPSGACTAGLPNQQVVTTGVMYSCQNGFWGISGGAGSGNTGSTIVTAWGDSLTFGNQDSTGVTYPSELSRLLGQTVSNQGIGGQTSSQIAVRMNAYAGTASQTVASDFTIPTSGTVNISFQTGFEPCTNTLAVSISISGVIGTCVFSGGVYTFTPTVYPASPVAVTNGTAWTANLYNSNALSGLNILWMGRNNYTSPTQVQADIAAAVAKIKAAGGTYLVMGVLNGEYITEWSGTTNYNTITALNSALSSTYGANYLSIRSLLVAAYNSSNATDVLDHTHDVPPYTLRAVDASGTLTAAITDTTSCPTTTSSSTLGGGAIMTFAGGEQILITGGSSGSWTCTRAFTGTASTYINGTAFTGVDPIHLGGVIGGNTVTGYGFVAQQVYNWITTNSSQNFAVSYSTMVAAINSALLRAEPRLFQGEVAKCRMFNSTTQLCMGDGVNAESGSSATLTAASSTSPALLTYVSGSTSGNQAGWNGNRVYYLARQPKVTFGVAYSASTDYSSNARIWLGLFNGSPVASDSPATSIAAIRYSTSASDPAYMCVAGTTTGLTAVSTGIQPTTAYTIMSVAVNGSSVVCTIGGISTTVTTTIPPPGGNAIFYLTNTTLANAATHIATDGVYGYSQNGSY